MDADDPNRIVQTITPPGGLDSSLWTESDPRPWKEKFFEGQKNYFFIITTQSLEFLYHRNPGSGRLRWKILIFSVDNVIDHYSGQW